MSLYVHLDQVVEHPDKEEEEEHDQAVHYDDEEGQVLSRVPTSPMSEVLAVLVCLWSADILVGAQHNSIHLQLALLIDDGAGGASLGV